MKLKHEHEEKMKTLTAENTNRTNGQGANRDPNSDVFAKLPRISTFSPKTGDLILKEQIYNSIHEQIMTFVEERKPKDVQAVKSIVDNYCDAHPDTELGKIFNVRSSFTKADKVDSHNFKRQSGTKIKISGKVPE
ncbi:hypothetical protein PoB_006672200 [Plakobranchus ocellatus]|uniref:Uncharacterized protein n=1 Tax=Plakobranchus ocellatus TaxID=259542 RepID=A0AAV4D7J0_9GAST|nr:hypothetical protein PoB_006672200 [Plakobranchus ocellatus]